MNSSFAREEFASMLVDWLQMTSLSLTLRHSSPQPKLKKKNAIACNEKSTQLLVVLFDKTGNVTTKSIFLERKIYQYLLKEISNM